MTCRNNQERTQIALFSFVPNIVDHMIPFDPINVAIIRAMAQGSMQCLQQPEKSLHSQMPMPIALVFNVA